MSGLITSAVIMGSHGIELEVKILNKIDCINGDTINLIAH